MSLVDNWLSRLRHGDAEARSELLASTRDRLRRLARTMFHDHPKLARWEEVDDVLQRATFRLWNVLAEHHPKTAFEYFRLAAQVMRRELIDLARHYFGPQGQGANHATPHWNLLSESGRESLQPADSTWDPNQLQAWTEFHQFVERLPDPQKATFDLLWYQGLSQAEAAELLGISERSIQRHWQAARMTIYNALKKSRSNDSAAANG